MPKPNVNDWTVITKAMKDFGQETQRLQQLTVKMTCPSLIAEFVNEFETSDCFLLGKPVGFEFWLNEISAESAPKIPYKKHMEAFKDFIMASENTRGPLFKGLVKLEWEEIFDVCMKMGDNLIYPMGYTQEMKPPKGVSNNLGIMMTLIKFLGTNPKNFNELRKFATQNTWTRTQKPIEEKDHNVLKSLGFLKQGIMDSVVNVAKHCERKYIIEKKVLEWARNQKKNEDLAKDLKKGYPKFPICGQMALNYNHLEDGVISDKTVGSSSSKMTSKLLFACICTLLEDALCWYNKNGPNPGLPNNNGVKNQSLHLYLR